MSTEMLIRKDTGMISTIRNNVDFTLPYLQQVVTSYCEVTEYFDIQSIRMLLVEFPKSVKDLENIIKNNIISNKPTPDLNGISLSKKVLSEFMEIQDCTQLYNKLRSLYSVLVHNMKYDIHNYYTLTADTQNSTILVSKVEGIDNVIESKYSYYTKNDNQVEFVTKVNQLLSVYTDLKKFNVHDNLKSNLKRVYFLDWNRSGEFDCTIKEGYVYQID